MKHIYSTIRGVALTASLLFFYSCTEPQRHWQFERNYTLCPQYRAGRLLFPPCIPSEGIELEILRTRVGYHMFINIRFCPVECEARFIPYVIEVDDIEYYAMGVLLQGGQRIMLQGVDGDMIMQAFLNNQPVTLKVENYSREFIPSNIYEVYDKIEHIPM